MDIVLHLHYSLQTRIYYIFHWEDVHRTLVLNIDTEWSRDQRRGMDWTHADPPVRETEDRYRIYIESIIISRLVLDILRRSFDSVNDVCINC